MSVLLHGLGICLVDGDGNYLLHVGDFNLQPLDARAPWLTVDRLTISQYPRYALVKFTYIKAGDPDPDNLGRQMTCNFYFQVLDASGKPARNVDCRQLWPDGGRADKSTGDDGKCDFYCPATFTPSLGQVGPYHLLPASAQGYPSESVWGVGLPLHQHDAWVGTWQLQMSAPGNPPPATRYKLSVKVVGEGIYRIDPLQADYAPGSTVVVTAIPDAGQTFVGWNGTLSDNPLVITMSADMNLTATFAPVPPPTDAWNIVASWTDSDGKPMQVRKGK
jgi:Divergent InlB B-repeat domain